MLLGEDAIRKLGSVGKVIPTVAARIVDENMNDVRPSAGQRIVYRRAHPDGRVLEQTAGHRRVVRRRLVPSGDLVRSDDENYLGRRPQEGHDHLRRREHLLRRSRERLAAPPGILEVAVIGRPDDRWGEVPVAVAAVSQAGLRLEDLAGFLDEQLARYKHPKSLEIVDALPRNPAGKVLKTELRLRFGATGTKEAQ